VHLAAAALGRGKIDLMAQPLKHGDDGPAGARYSVSVRHVTNKPIRIKAPSAPTLQDARAAA